MIECWFDGACEPMNPGGHASYGSLVKDGNKILLAKSGYVGYGPEMSNNVAEYCGARDVFQFLVDNHIAEGIVRGDSNLVVMQLNRKWRARKGLYIPYYREALKLRLQVPRIELKWIPRAQNEEADYLSRQAIKTAPRASKRNQRLVKLIKAQRADARDRYFRFENAIRK